MSLWNMSRQVSTSCELQYKSNPRTAIRWRGFSFSDTIAIVYKSNPPGLRALFFVVLDENQIFDRAIFVCCVSYR